MCWRGNEAAGVMEFSKQVEDYKEVVCSLGEGLNLCDYGGKGLLVEET